MRLSEGEELDDALELFHNHSWVEHKPQISTVQMAELVPVLAPLFQRSRSRVRQEKPKQKVQNRPKAIRQPKEIPDTLRDDVLDRDERTCQRCGLGLEGQRYSLHHRRRRQVGGHSMANLVSLCGSGTTGCHGEVESYRTIAIGEGWLVPEGVKPEQWPVRRWTPDGLRWMQPGDGWVPASPHPDQADDEGKVA